MRGGKISLGQLVGLVAVLVVLAAGAWVYHHFAVNLRLPQERSLTIQGKNQQVRLESCNKLVVKYALMADGTTHFTAIEKLSDGDQDFIRQLPKTLVFNYPFEMLLDQGDGQPALARIEGHNADWMKYTLLSDHSTHYLPLTSLTASDQVVLQQLPNYFSVEFPVLLAMTDQQGQFLPARIEGRSENLVKLSTTDGVISYYPVSALAAVDQKLVRLLPTSFYFNCPVECTLTNQQDQKLNVRVEGRSANLVKYTLLNDGLVYYVPTADFSSTDQQVLRELPSTMTFSFPIEYTITDVTGQPLRVRLEGRTANLVKYTSLTDGLQHYLPLSSFSAVDQKFFQLLPADLVVDFPLNYTLTAVGGQPLEARILGRDADSVKFQLADGKTYNYSMDKLSTASQAFLKELPANLVDASVTPPPPTVSARSVARTLVAPDLDSLHGKLQNLVRDYQKIQDAIEHPRGGPNAFTGGVVRTGSVTSSSGATTTFSSIEYVVEGRIYHRDQLNAMLSTNSEQIEAVCKQVNDNLSNTPGQHISINVQSWWQQAMEKIKHGNQIRREISSAGPSESQALENELFANQKDLVILLNRINAETGQYSP